MYYGCLTRSNRARWLATGILLFVSLALAVVYALEAHTCQECNDARNGRPQCKSISDKMDPDSMKDVKECRQVLLVASFAGFVICAVTALIPCCAMTCCVDSPEFYTMEEQDDGVGCKELPTSAMAPSFARTKTHSAQPHCAPPSTTRGVHSIFNLYGGATDPKANVPRAGSSIRGPAAAAAAIAAARGVRCVAATEDRAGAAPQDPMSTGTVVSAGSRGSLIVDSSVDSWARPLLPEGIRRSSLTADSYSTNPSVVEASTVPTPRVDVPVILDVGPIAATAADVEASVNGDQGTKVACSTRAFESTKNLEELSTMLTSIASSTHSQAAVAAAAHAACAGHAIYESVDSQDGPQSGAYSGTLLPPAAVLMHEALGSRYHIGSINSMQNYSQGEIHAAESLHTTWPTVDYNNCASRPGEVTEHDIPSMAVSPEQVILESSQPLQLPSPLVMQHRKANLPPTPRIPGSQSNLPQSNAQAQGGSRSVDRGSAAAAHGVNAQANDRGREGVYGYPGIVPRSLSKMRSSSAHSTGSGRSVADSETHTESSISSASISYWANHASIQRASQQLHSAQHGAQQAAQHTPQGTTKPSAAVASPVSQYSNVHVPHSTGSSIPAYVETLSVSAPGSASATMDQDAYAYSNTNTSSHPFLPLTPLPDSESSETGNHRKPIIMPPMHVKAGQLPRSSSGRELRDTIDARMHGMHMANQNAKSFRSNPTYQQASVPGSGGLQACSKATSWYHPSGSRKQPQQPPQQQQQQPNSAMHASHAPSFNSVESEQQAAQAALAAYSQNASDSEHLAVVNQQPKATLATVGPQSGTTQRVPSLDLPRDVQQGIEVVSEPAKLSDRSLLRAAQNLQQPRRLPQCPPHHLMNTLPSYMEAAEITPAYRNAYDDSGPSSRQERQRYGSPAPLEGGRTDTDGSPGAEVSAAWARVAGGSGGLNAWYQQDRLPRSADDTSHNSPRSSTSPNLDEKWVAFARQEVAELRLPTLQPKATFLL